MPVGTQHKKLTPQELARAKDKLESLQNPVAIKVIVTKHPLSDHLRRFIGELATVSDKIRPLYLTDSGDKFPALQVKANLRYLALPLGRELDPFLQTLSSHSRGNTVLSDRSVSALEGFIAPTRVEVMMGPGCPHCPAVVGLACQLALANSYLQVNIIDVTLFTDYAEMYNIRGVPTVVVNGEEPLAGNVTEEIFVDMLINQSPSTFHPDTFKKIVKEGDAASLAAMMVKDGDVYSGALELLADPDWSVRMGMMVVLEDVADRRPDLIRKAYPYLLALLDHDNANLRGDSAYLLGQIGDADVLGELQLLITDSHPEVAAAAIEAVENIRKRETVRR